MVTARKSMADQQEITHCHLTMSKQVSIILQNRKFNRSFFFNHHKEELMKPANVQLPKELKTGKMLQRKLGNIEFKLKFKDQRTNRQRIGLSVTAGHVRGGHSFH
jgi:pyridoxine 5'-phosphate synthase PdxJ